MGKTADLTVVQKTIIDTLHKEDKTQTFITKEAVHRVLYPSMLTESWVEEKDAQPTERTAAYEDCQAKSIQEFGWTSQGMDWGWGQGIKSTTHRRVEEFGYSCHQRRLTWAKKKKNWTVAQWSKDNLWDIVKRKMRNKRPKNADELKATVKETWASHHLSSATNWSPPCHAELRQ